MKYLQRVSIIMISLILTLDIASQDYTQQIEAFAQSFEDKNLEILQPHIGSTLQFGEFPVSNTVAILNNIVTKLPKLNSMSIIESEKGKAKVAYDFVGFGKSDSFIHFDDEGKITRIILVEDLINQEIQAQRQQKVPLPTPGTLGSKYNSAKVEFAATDGLLINGDLYEVDKNAQIILLSHQAGYNRIEYADIAPKLNEMGYNCLAVDLRSGGTFAEKSNITQARAIDKGLQPEMIDAQQDIAAAVSYLNNKYKKKVIVWGSSFSSSLALLEGLDNPNIKAIVAFSPGDYFDNAAPSLSTVFSNIKIPYLVTSSKQEAATLSALIGNSKSTKHQSQFIPESNGFHGSRALWEGQEGAEEYWKAITQFLAKQKTN